MEKRKHKRWNLAKSLKVIDNESDRYLGNINDITTAGLGMISNRPIEPEKTVNIKIDLSEEDIQFKNVEIKGESVWCDKKLVNLYFAGIKFKNLNEDIIKKIKCIIHWYCFAS